jgi:stage II sporulation protein P
MNKARITVLTGIGLLLIGGGLLFYLVVGRDTVPTFSPARLLNLVEYDHQDGVEYVIRDHDGNVLSKMARRVAPGDRLTTAGGKNYEVERVDGRAAVARFNGLDKDILAYTELFSREEVAVLAAARAADKNPGRVAIYHTHSAESYVPTDGTDSIPFKGGIFQVGKALSSRLKKEWVLVDHDLTPHEPRDDNAYYRSRRTAARLMQRNPIALLDVHRDGIPDPGFYREQVGDEQVAALRLVIGRQNPRMSSNEDFAKRMMSYANQVNPGIVKEIFYARGNYNQDLMSTALLIEAGTHTNSREEAERGVMLFAEAIPVVLGIGTGAGEPGAFTDRRAGTPGAWTALAWILGLTILGAGGFLLYSSGGLDKARERLSGFMGKEFNLKGLTNPLRKPEDGQGDKEP